MNKSICQTPNPIRDGLAPQADKARENQSLLMSIHMHVIQGALPPRVKI